MRKTTSLVLLLGGLALALSCTKEKASSSAAGGSAYLDLPTTPYDYGFDVTGNRLATLGRVLFYDRRLSVNNSVSCGSCHKQQFAFADNTAFSRGFESRMTHRNSMPIQNMTLAVFGIPPSFFWDGRENNLKQLISRPMAHPVEMGLLDLNEVPARLANLPYYPSLFKGAFGSEDITLDKVTTAITWYVSSIKANNTRFDQANEGLLHLNALEEQGSVLFRNTYNCASCHNILPGVYQGNEIVNIGLPERNGDLGKAALYNNNPLYRNQFRTPNLRNVGLTAPYMHDGRFKTLDEVLDHYSHGIENMPNLDDRLKDASGQPLRMNIPDQDKKALIAFLNALTDYDMITDEKYADPFKVK